MNLDSEHGADERELDLQRAELAALATDLVERELGLSTLQQELAAFQAEYLCIVGASYAVLDDSNARLAEARAARRPDDGAQEEAIRARRRADDTRRELANSALDPTQSFDPPAALKKLYRTVARRLHPDLASTDQERKLRGPWMERLGVAYGMQDGDALESLLAEWGRREEPVRRSEVAGDLARAWLFGELATEDYTDRTRIACEGIEVARQIGRAKQRICDISRIADDLKAGALHELYRRHRTGLDAGRNLLNEMAARLEMKAAYARREGVVRRDPRTHAIRDAMDLPERGLADLERRRVPASIKRPGEQLISEDGGGVEFTDEQWGILRPRLDRQFRLVRANTSRQEGESAKDYSIRLFRQFIAQVREALKAVQRHVVDAALRRWYKETKGGRDVSIDSEASGQNDATATPSPASGATADGAVEAPQPEEVPGAGAEREGAQGGETGAGREGGVGVGSQSSESPADSDGGRAAHETRAESGAGGPVVDKRREMALTFAGALILEPWPFTLRWTGRAGSWSL